MPVVGEIIEGSFGRFELIKTLGSGGMAEVFLAANLDEHGHEYALKFVREELLDDEELIQRFVHEAKNLRNLAHPNIVRFYDFYASLPDYAYIVMDYIPGQSLQALLRSYGPRNQRIPPLTFTLPVLMRLSMGLTRIHNARTIHRDVKTANILIHQDNCDVFLSDLGIARNLQHSQFMTQGVVGTMAYMAPEQHQNHTLSAATDVYALGTIAFEMLVGRRPFLGDLDTKADPSLVSITRNEAILVQRLTQPPPSASVLNPKLPPAVDDVLFRVLAVEPEDRPQRTNDFISELHQALLPILPAELHDIRTLGQIYPYPAPEALVRAGAVRSTNPAQAIPVVPSAQFARQEQALPEKIDWFKTPEHLSAETSAPPVPSPSPKRGKGLLVGGFLFAVLLTVAVGIGVVLSQQNGLTSSTEETLTSMAVMPTTVVPATDLPPTTTEEPDSTDVAVAPVLSATFTQTPTSLPTIRDTATLVPSTTATQPATTASVTPTVASTKETARTSTAIATATQTPRQFVAPTQLPTFTPSMTVTLVPSATIRPTIAPSDTIQPTQPLAITATVTSSPPPTIIPTMTHTPLPVFTMADRQLVLSNLQEIIVGGQVAFNCELFVETYNMLQTIEQMSVIPDFAYPYYELIDDEADPIQRIYSSHCQYNAAATMTSLPAQLRQAFVQMLQEVNNLQ